MRRGDKVDAVPKKDVFDFLDTEDGAAMSFWLMMRKKNPKITLEESQKIMSDVSLAEALSARDELTVGKSE
jgi:hypothetical protein